MTMRDYQEFAVGSIFNFFAKEATGNPVVAMPTGTGKSHVISNFIKQVLTRWPTQRIMMLTHVKELISQNAQKLRDDFPLAPVGFFSAGLKKKQVNYPITFAGIQSCAKCAAVFGHIDLVIIDECHLVSPNENTTYQKFLADLKAVNPNLRVIGLSATAYRLGLGQITDGGIFTHVCCDMTTMDGFNWFIDNGYLTQLVPMPTTTQLDVTGVAKRGGEYVEKDVQRAVDKSEITFAALREAIESAGDRESILVFAAGVDHVIHIHDALEMLGETVVCVHSRMSSAEREAALADHAAGRARWLVNANILTTGYDDPRIDCIVMLRPTMSPGLWVQMLGRGTRPLYLTDGPLLTPEDRLAAIHRGGKRTCLVLDFAGNTMRLGPVNDPVIPKKKGAGGGEPPVKFCEKKNTRAREGQVPCGCYNHTSARICVNCGAEFVFQSKLTTQASSEDLIRRKKAPKPEGEAPVVATFPVDKVVYEIHRKPGGADSLKVTYQCGIRRFVEWVPAWHAGNIRHRGKAWWDERSAEDLPETVEEALASVDSLRVPSHVRVWVNRKYPEIMACHFNGVGI